MKNKTLFSTLIIAFTFLFSGVSQSLKSKNFNVKTPYYASLVKPKDVNTYGVELALGSGEVLNFTSTELKEKFILEDFTKAEENTTPDLFFAISGISRKVLAVKGALGPATPDSYSLKILPKEKAKIRIAVLVKGEIMHIWERGISYKVDAGKPIPYIIDFKAKDKDKYLVTLPHSSLPDITQYTIQKFLDKSLGENYLEYTLIPEIKETYDNSLKNIRTQFYFLKDKKDKKISETSKTKLESFKELCKTNFTSLKYLRENEDEITPYITYWESVLEKYPTEDKNSKKIIWGMAMNLHQTYLLLEDFKNAQKYIDKAVSIGNKKSYTKAFAKDLTKLISLYNNNYDSSTQEKKYAPKYEKNDLAKFVSGE